jgi:DNA-binding SARP family transcriptional activator
MEPIDFGVLGPVAAFAGGHEIPIGGGRIRSILATLLMHANRTVSADTLVDAAFSPDPPSSARLQVQNRLCDLRRTLRRAGDGTDPITRTGSGYTIRLQPGQLDLDRFEHHVALAGSLAQAGREDAAASELTAALALWRGPALDGLNAPPLVAAAQRLEERRLAARIGRAELLLALQRHHDAIAELSELAHQHPYQEKVYELLMRALQGCGRQAEALETFHRVRDILVSQLGIEPGPMLRELHEAILRGDKGGVTGPPWPPIRQAAQPVLNQLPQEPRPFVGRAAELATLDALRQAPQAPNVFVITGAAGAGKTALAVHWARRLAPQYPGGVLYLNLRGFDLLGTPLKSIEALRYFLHSLNLPVADMPHDTEAAAARFRSLLAGRHMLVLLDNARNPDQVRQLLPGAPTCTTLVTSRNRLTGLVASHGAVPLELPLMTAADAVRLLEAVLGEKASGELDAVTTLAAKCSYLPLALRIAAAKLLCNKHLSIADYLGELAGGDTLAALAPGDGDTFAVKAAFTASYRDLPDAARRLFCLLHLLPGTDFGPHAAAALAGLAPEEASRWLGELCDTHMVEQDRADRFVLHDLLRQYSHARAKAEIPPHAATQALRRLTDFYSDTLFAAYPLILKRHPRAARELIFPPEQPLRFPDRDSALTWHDLERPSFVPLIEAAAAQGWHRVAWQLADSLFAYCMNRRHWPEWEAAAQIGLQAAEAAGDHLATARMHNALGVIAKQTGRYGDAHFHYTQALKLAEAAGDTRLVGGIQVNLGALAINQGDPRTGVEHLRQALQDLDHRENPSYATITYLNFGCALIDLDELAEAHDFLTRSLDLARRAGDDIHACFAHNNLAEIALRRHDPGTALTHAGQALRHAIQAGDPLRHATALDMLASCQAFRDLQAAVGTWRRALEIYCRLRHRLRTALEDWLARLDTSVTSEVIRLDEQRRRAARRMV